MNEIFLNEIFKLKYIRFKLYYVNIIMYINNLILYIYIKITELYFFIGIYYSQEVEKAIIFVKINFTILHVEIF